MFHQFPPRKHPPTEPTLQGVFTSLVENLGVKGVQFEELISLDADTIRSLRYVSLSTPLPTSLSQRTL